ncbi:unnamed protein product [Amoebophrya sp. A120]|nr:unnamed protein product [Amoebophrya sp. A120]|eukprot:GSA120T00021214001.1
MRQPAPPSPLPFVFLSGWNFRGGAPQTGRGLQQSCRYLPQSGRPTFDDLAQGWALVGLEDKLVEERSSPVAQFPRMASPFLVREAARARVGAPPGSPARRHSFVGGVSSVRACFRPAAGLRCVNPPEPLVAAPPATRLGCAVSAHASLRGAGTNWPARSCELFDREEPADHF